MAFNPVARQPDFADLDLDFIAHPTTGDIVRKRGFEALRRSVRNLILTNFYDRPFRHGIGSNAQKILFDNISPLTATYLKNAIVEVITNFEPRVKLTEVMVVANADLNGYDARIAFLEKNTSMPVEFDVFLERIR